MILGRTDPISYTNKNAISGFIELKTGFFAVSNDKVTVYEGGSATEFRYDFTSLRKCQFPWYKQDEKNDHLMLEWQGMKLDEQQIEDASLLAERQKKRKN